MILVLLLQVSLHYCCSSSSSEPPLTIVILLQDFTKGVFVWCIHSSGRSLCSSIYYSPGLLLSNEPVLVKRGLHIVEVKPQGISKGIATEKLFSTMVTTGKTPDFVMCIGDNRADEDMFESILSFISSASLQATPEIFACTVGRKPNKAKYYLDNTVDVVNFLKGLTSGSDSKPKYSSTIQFSFGNVSDLEMEDPFVL